MTIYNQISANKWRTSMIIALFIALISFFFYLVGTYVGDSTSYFLIGMVLSFASGIGSYFYSDKIVLLMTGAKRASKEEYFDFYTVTENLSIAAGLPMPKLYVIRDSALNAFATGRNPHHAVIVATTGILSRLERSELEGVIGHELSHVKNYDILVMSIVTILVGTLVFVSDWIMRMMWWGGLRRSNNDNGRGGNVVSFV